MRSFAIWYESTENKIAEDNKNNIKADIHINLFSNPDSDTWYIDFGIMVQPIKLISQIHIYCPFNLDKNDVYDIGKLINDSLVRGIFNEDYKVTNNASKRKLVTGNHNGKKNSFIIYTLNKTEEIQIDKLEREDNGNLGTIITIDVSDIRKFHDDNDDFTSEDKYYFRIRLRVSYKEIQAISCNFEGKPLLQLTLSKTDIIDFRLNNTRSLCKEVRNKISLGKAFLVKSVHYIILRDYKDDIIYNSDKKCSTRLLEKDIWHSYFEDLFNEHIIAYHFKEKAIEGNDSSGINQFNILVKFRKNVVKGINIKLYIAGLIFFGVIASLLATAIIEILKFYYEIFRG